MAKPIGWLSALVIAGCGGGGDLAKIQVTPNVVAGSAGVAARVGSPSAHTLTSLKYFISGIQLCQDVELMGTGWNNPKGCIELYRNPSGTQPDYMTYTVAEAMADTTPGHYIDLMSPAGQAELRRPVTLEVPVADPTDPEGSLDGAYRFGIIGFYRPIKVTAEFPLATDPGTYFRTRSVTHVNVGTTPDGRFNTNRVEIGDTLSGPTEETTYMLNNGGTVFTFQKPFVVTQADLDAHAEIKMDLVFNPDSFGQAYETQEDCTQSQYSAVCDPTNRVVIDMPYVRMNPVPRKTGEHTRKETYLLDYDGPTKLRLELYYNDGDPEASIQGVDAAVVYAPTSDHPNNVVIASNYVSQTGSVTSGTADVTLMDYQHAANLEHLVRRTDGTATVHCLFAGTLCPTTGGTVTTHYTYVGDSLVSSD